MHYAVVIAVYDSSHLSVTLSIQKPVLNIPLIL